jgi:hypothetical protein
MANERRSRVIVESFQRKLLWRFVSYWVIFQLTAWNFLFAWQLLREGSGNPIGQHSRFLSENFPSIAVFAFLVPFYLWDVSRFTNGVAGPIYRLRKTIQGMTNGEPVRFITLRNGDHLTELADELNQLMLVLEERGAVTIDRSGSKAAGDNERADAPLECHTA